ncbi:hypothetical protein [Bosea sp. RAC05]|uniref:hypothetical protein n=1 Tax=Bosea sp. RAC05 TaxID=1842539 RepID=UPI0012375BD5|nr:hypothetical protein [Bosea sp. RAC05]
MQMPFEPMPVHEFVGIMEALRCPGCGGKKLLMGQGRTAAQDDSFDHGQTPEERQRLWLENGETGNSSAAIFGWMTGRWVKASHPLDTDDLRRCVLLLRRFPEWQERMLEMTELSPEWRAIATNWARLQAAFVAEATPALLRRKMPVTAALLASLIAQDAA